MHDTAYIFWNADPILFSLGPLTVRWYGLFFALAFLLGYGIVPRLFRREGKPEGDLDILLAYVMVGTVVGARLGHMLFYDPVYYILNPVEIINVWEGGLASRGGAIGIFAALYLYARRHPDQPYLWLLDQIAVPTALSGILPMRDVRHQVTTTRSSRSETDTATPASTSSPARTGLKRLVGVIANTGHTGLPGEGLIAILIRV